MKQDSLVYRVSSTQIKFFLVQVCKSPLCITKIAQNLSGVIVHTANSIFGQEWKLFGGLIVNKDREDSEDDESLTENDYTPKHCKRPITYIFPSRSALNRYVEDASYSFL